MVHPRYTRAGRAYWSRCEAFPKKPENELLKFGSHCVKPPKEPYLSGLNKPQSADEYVFARLKMKQLRPAAIHEAGRRKNRQG